MGYTHIYFEKLLSGPNNRKNNKVVLFFLEAMTRISPSFWGDLGFQVFGSFQTLPIHDNWPPNHS